VSLKGNTEAQIKVAEVQHVLQHHFKPNKSTGLSVLPLQCLKWLGNDAIPTITTFLNDTAIN
jgi:hypothetical protein